MKILVNEIKRNIQNESFMFDQVVDVSKLVDLNNDIRQIEPVRVQGNCIIEGERFIFSLTISGVMILPCARTLVDVPYSFEINEVEIYSESPYFGREEEENEIYPVEGEVIDLTPSILENISLAIPFRVITEDKEALEQALVEGNGWVLSLEEDQEELEKQEKTIDPRLKKLQSLLDNNKEEK